MKIASLENVATGMGQVSKLVRLLASSGITSEHLQYAIDNKSARANLVEFLQAGCPKVDYMQSVPKATRAKTKAEKLPLVKPAEFFVSSDQFYVDSNFARNIDLSPCADDTRDLKALFTLPRPMSDSAIATHSGGLPELLRKRPALPQLMRECQLALAGRSRLFVKGGFYLLYIEGRVGSLCPVCVRCDGVRFGLFCYRFGQFGEWRKGSLVCGN